MSHRARFCEHCGTALKPSATPLRAPSRLEAKILEGRTGIEGERKQVTVMYTDVVGSMELTRSLEAERWAVVLDRFLAIAADAVHQFEGTVNQFTGDGLMAVFGAPLAHEDHARRACLAVLELQREAVRLAAEVARSDGVDFSIRCGLNSGEVIVGSIGDDVHMDFVPVGNTTALGKRIESLAPVGSTAIGASTAALIEGEFELRELGEFEVKGAGSRQRLLELVGPGAAQTRLEALAATRGLSQFVGRESERAKLESALDRALAGEGQAIGIVGDPGVGKSRLVREFVAACAVRGLTVNSTAGFAHGRYVPFSALLALYLDYFGIHEQDAPEIVRQRIERTMLALDPSFAPDLPLLFEFLGVPDPDRPLEPEDPDAHQRRLLSLTARTVKARGSHEAAVLVVEDLQWIDDASAAHLEELVAAVVGTRVVVVCTYRPEYEAPWTSNPPHAQLTLDPLDPDATDDLITGLLGRDPSLDGLSALIQARARGNPFFVEEIVQALAENRHLSGGPGDYRLATELERVVLPATVHAGLAARIDGLPSREKALVQTMSVIGTEIPGPVLSDVSDLGEGELDEAVAALARAQFVVASGLSGTREYAFKHPLTQEVAYGSQLTERRARAHHAVAAAIERAYPDGLDERAALLAHHCEASGDNLAGARWHARAATWTEVGSPTDAMRHWHRVRDLARKLDASPERDDLATEASVRILGLAWRLGMAPDDSDAIHSEGHAPARADVELFRLDLNYAATLMHSGREQAGLELFRDVSRRAVATGDPGLVLTSSLGVSYAAWIAGSLSEAVEVIDRAVELAGDDPATGAGLAFVCPFAHAFVHRGQGLGYLGRLEAARRDFDRGSALAREHDDSEVESFCHGNLALLEAMIGNTKAAIGAAALGLEIAERAGNAIAKVATSTPRAIAEAESGYFADALARAESNLVTVRRHGMGLYYEPMLLATIARSKLALGEPGAALAAAEDAVDITNARGLATCALQAPIALAQVLLATQGAAAGERVETVLERAARVARESRARIFEPQIRRELAALARLRGDYVMAEREQAEAERTAAAMRSGEPWRDRNASDRASVDLG